MATRFPSLRMPETSSMLGNSSDKTVVLFRWTHGGQNVFICGSFNNWEAIPMILKQDALGRGTLFSIRIELPVGKHFFRFLVDGELKYDPTTAVEINAVGSFDNVIDVQRIEGTNLLTPLKRQAWISEVKSTRSNHLTTCPQLAKITSPITGDDDVIALPHELTPGVQDDIDGVIDATHDVTSVRNHLPRPVSAEGFLLLRNARHQSFPDADKLRLMRLAEEQSQLDESRRKQALVIKLTEKIDRANLESEYGLTPKTAPGSREGFPVPQAATAAFRRSRSFDADPAQDYQLTKPQSASISRTHSKLNLAEIQLLENRVAPFVGTSLLRSNERREGKLLIVMVGLPARGKTFIARQVLRHLQWMGLETAIFEISSYRREMLGKVDMEYFDPGNSFSSRQREDIERHVLGEAISALRGDLSIAIYDAANTSTYQRQRIRENVSRSGLRCQILYIESVITQPDLIRALMKDTCFGSPDYAGVTQEQAIETMQVKVMHFQNDYTPMDVEENVSYLKLIDIGRQIVSNNFHGYLPGRIMLLLANIHVTPRPIWMSRHGESQFNTQNRIGGDSALSPLGEQYAAKLTEFIRQLYPNDESLTVWTSCLVRTGQTVAELSKSFEVVKWKALNEIDAGLMDGLTYEEFAEQFPEHYEARAKDKLGYRYPRGESYQDVFQRLEPVIFEMLRQTGPLLIVGHQAILRVLYGYLTGKSPNECPTLDMPLHAIIQLIPRAYSCDEIWHKPMA